ncbi:MAG: hotdog fold thioesterase [Saprospiraceae bacterium]|nr:hotdog fold thioesterase [Saprospiraceae bacterium]
MPEIFKFRPTLEQLNDRFENTLGEVLGIQIIALGEDSITATMPVDRRTHQPLGLLHGGASAALAETLGSIASLLCIDQPNTYPVGIEINANHLTSVSSGFVTATARPFKIGRTLHVWNIEIRNEKEELICISRLTVMLITKS